MQTACLLVWLTGLFPLWRAWKANRHTSLVQAVCWAIVSWAGWGLAIVKAASGPSLATTASCYLALSLTGCAAIAVLGARRPGAQAWNFVVVALLAVDLLPLTETMLTVGMFLDNPWQFLLVSLN